MLYTWLFRDVAPLSLYITLVLNELIPFLKTLASCLPLSSDSVLTVPFVLEVLIPSLKSLLCSCFPPEDAHCPLRSWPLRQGIPPSGSWLPPLVAYDFEVSFSQKYLLHSLRRLEVLTPSSWCLLSSRIWSPRDFFLLKVLLPFSRSLLRSWFPLQNAHCPLKVLLSSSRSRFLTRDRHWPSSPHFFSPKYFRVLLEPVLPDMMQETFFLKVLVPMLWLFQMLLR